MGMIPTCPNTLLISGFQDHPHGFHRNGFPETMPNPFCQLRQCPIFNLLRRSAGHADDLMPFLRRKDLRCAASLKVEKPRHPFRGKTVPPLATSLFRNAQFLRNCNAFLPFRSEQDDLGPEMHPMLHAMAMDVLFKLLPFRWRQQYLYSYP